MAKQRRADRGASAMWARIGLAMLAVVVLALSFVALTQNRTVAEAGSTPGATAPSVDPSASPVQTQAPAPVATSVAVPTRVLAAIDSDAAVRAVATTCPAPSTIETTGDAGATWETFEAEGVSAAQRITAGADAFVTLIGLAVEGCDQTYERSFTGGMAWEPAPDELAASWFVDPANRAAVHSPSGDVAAPCAVVVQLAAIDENSAAVLCDDSSVHATVDAGGSWLPPTSLPGASAIAAGGVGYVVAVVNQNGCVGAQLVEVGVEVALIPGAPGACLAATVAPGGAAVATGGDVTWLWVGDALGRSTDGGATWS